MPSLLRLLSTLWFLNARRAEYRSLNSSCPLPVQIQKLNERSCVQEGSLNGSSIRWFGGAHDLVPKFAIAKWSMTKEAKESDKKDAALRSCAARVVQHTRTKSPKISCHITENVTSKHYTCLNLSVWRSRYNYVHIHTASYLSDHFRQVSDICCDKIWVFSISTIFEKVHWILKEIVFVSPSVLSSALLIAHGFLALLPEDLCSSSSNVDSRRWSSRIRSGQGKLCRRHQESFFLCALLPLI